jgi:hypothetical protein
MVKDVRRSEMGSMLSDAVEKSRKVGKQNCPVDFPGQKLLHVSIASVKWKWHEVKSHWIKN